MMSSRQRTNTNPTMPTSVDGDDVMLPRLAATTAPTALDNIDINFTSRVVWKAPSNTRRESFGKPRTQSTLYSQAGRGVDLELEARDSRSRSFGLDSETILSKQKFNQHLDLISSATDELVISEPSRGRSLTSPDLGRMRAPPVLKDRQNRTVDDPIMIEIKQGNRTIISSNVDNKFRLPPLVINPSSRPQRKRAETEWRAVDFSKAVTAHQAARNRVQDFKALLDAGESQRKRTIAKMSTVRKPHRTARYLWSLIRDNLTMLTTALRREKERDAENQLYKELKKCRYLRHTAQQMEDIRKAQDPEEQKKCPCSSCENTSKHWNDTSVHRVAERERKEKQACVKKNLDSRRKKQAWHMDSIVTQAIKNKDRQ